MTGRAIGCLGSVILVVFVFAPAAGQSVPPWEIEQGSIWGRVFLDRDGDGCFSAGDTGLDGVRVLTDKGSWSLTDNEGRYHIDLQRTGVELMGSVVVRLDSSSLTFGFSAKPAWHLLHLRPGSGPERADFCIQATPEDLAQPRGIEPAGNRRQTRLTPKESGTVETEITGVIPADCRLWIDGTLMEVGLDGLFVWPVEVNRGVNPHLLGLHCSSGTLELWLVEVHRIARRLGGELVVTTSPRNLTMCATPGPEPLPVVAKVPLTCRTDVGVDLSIGGKSLGGAGDSSRIELDVQSGVNDVPISVVSRQGQLLSGNIRWTVRSTSLSGVLLGAVAIHLALDGSSPQLSVGAKLGGSLEWKLPEDIKLILSSELYALDLADVRDTQILEEVFSPGRSTDRLTRAPDPDSGTLAWADGAVVEDWNPARSRYQLRVTRKRSYLEWGSFRTPGAGVTDVGQYQRTLSGAHLRLLPLEDWFPIESEPKVGLELEGFYARPDAASESSATGPVSGMGEGANSFQTPAHEEYAATGGTLYLLGRRWVVAGSERVVVERRDVRTGFCWERRELVRNREYDIDWLTGRLLLTEPVESGWLSQGAVRLLPAGTQVSVLVVDYEHLTGVDSDPREDVFGGRVRLQGRPLGPLLLAGSFSAVGATSAGRSADYRLFTTTAQARLGTWGELWAAWANSSGRALDPRYSMDGGISFASPVAPDRATGEAYEAGATWHVGPVLGRFGFRRWLDGYADTTRVVSGDRNQWMAEIRAELARWLGASVQAALESFTQGDWAQVVAGLVFRPVAGLEVLAEGAFDSAQPADAQSEEFERWYGSGSRVLAGLKASYRLVSWLSLTAGHQQSLYRDGDGRIGRDLSMTTAGGQFHLDEAISIGVEGGWGPSVGNLVRFSVNDDRGGRGNSFAYTTLGLNEGSAVGVTAGQVVPIGDSGLALSTSHNVVQTATAAMVGQRVGLDVPFSDRWRFHIAYERSEMEGAADGNRRLEVFPGPFAERGLPQLTLPGRRNAAFGGLAFLGNAFVASADAELRIDERLPLADDDWISPTGPTDHRQVVLRAALRWAPLDGLSLGGRVAWGETFGRIAGSEGVGFSEGGFFEASAGVAYRPARLDWLRLMLRLSAGRADGLRGETGAATRSESWGTGTVALSFFPTRYFLPTLALSPWLRRLQLLEGERSLDQWGVLGMIRVGSQLVAGFGLATELRLLYGDRNFDLLQPDDLGFQLGCAAEVFYDFSAPDVGGLRLALGYSFSDVPDPLLSDFRSGSQGLYIRLEGML